MDDFVSKSDRFKNLCTLIALQCGDAHFCHHFEHPLGNSLTIGGHQILIFASQLHRVDTRCVIRGLDIGRRFDYPLPPAFPERLESEIGIDAIGTVSDEQTVVVDFTGFARFNHDTNPRPFCFADQMVVDRTGGKKRTQRHPLCRNRSVRKDEQAKTLIDGFFRLPTNAIDRREQPLHSLASWPGDIEGSRLPTSMGKFFKPCKLLVGKNRMRHPQTMAMPLGRFK